MVQVSMMQNYFIHSNRYRMGWSKAASSVWQGDETLIPRLERLISKKRYITIGKGDALVDVTCLGNFLDAISCAISASDEALHRFYNISNGDARSFKTIVAAYANRHGVQLKHRSVPLLPVLLYAKLIETFASMIPGKAGNQQSLPMA